MFGKAALAFTAMKSLVELRHASADVEVVGRILCKLELALHPNLFHMNSARLG